MNIEIAGNLYNIQFIQDGKKLCQILKNKKPKMFTYDTETTGLHVKKDKPFVGAICFDQEVYIFPTTHDILHMFPSWCREVQYVVGHNMPFDINMTCNIIGDTWLKAKDMKHKFMDTMNMVRLSTESMSENRGGINLKLKSLSKTFIDPHSDRFEVELKKELKILNKERDSMLKIYLKEVGYTLKAFRELEKHIDDVPLPDDLQASLDLWNEDYPEASYDMVSKEVLYPYLAADVILTKLLAEMCSPIIADKKQTKVLLDDCPLIPAVVRMARVGLEVDFDYLKESRKRIIDEINAKYEELWSFTGDKVRIGQHKKIKEYYHSKGVMIESSNKKTLSEIGDRESIIIGKLRTLEKWKSTYIDKIIRDASYDGRFYSLLSPFYTVTGRFSGDAQQFPKFPMMYDDGETELYFPRRAFKGDWVFADFSQQELRVATHFAMQLGVEDFNLFRAYMPYKCKHYKTSEVYDKQNHDWSELKEDGSSAWVTETGEAWKATDLHSSTASQTIKLLNLAIKEGDKEWKLWRNRAKTTNFGKLYGATWKALVEQLGVPKDVAMALDEGYYQAFPSLKVYAQKIERAMKAKGYVQNLYGRQYHMTDPSDFYRAGNMIIQGSCAYDVKRKLTKIQDYLDEVNAKTQMVLTVHDEIIYTRVKGEEHIIAECVKIMENSDNLLVPLVSEQEYTKTTWADKKSA